MNRYQAALYAIDQGFCVIEIQFGPDERVHDYRFLEVNPAFERLTGFTNAVGRSMREIAAATEQHWFHRTSLRLR